MSFPFFEQLTSAEKAKAVAETLKRLKGELVLGSREFCAYQAKTLEIVAKEILDQRSVESRMKMSIDASIGKSVVQGSVYGGSVGAMITTGQTASKKRGLLDLNEPVNASIGSTVVQGSVYGGSVGAMITTGQTASKKRGLLDLNEPLKASIGSTFVQGSVHDGGSVGATITTTVQNPSKKKRNLDLEAPSPNKKKNTGPSDDRLVAKPRDHGGKTQHTLDLLLAQAKYPQVSPSLRAEWVDSNKTKEAVEAMVMLPDSNQDGAAVQVSPTKGMEPTKPPSKHPAYWSDLKKCRKAAVYYYHQFTSACSKLDGHRHINSLLGAKVRKLSQKLTQVEKERDSAIALAAHYKDQFERWAAED